MMYGWTGDWGWMILTMVLNAVVWIALIGVVIWAISRFFTQRGPSTGQPYSGPSAMEILRQRFARGEIDEATFERMRQQLESPAARETLTVPPER